MLGKHLDLSSDPPDAAPQVPGMQGRRYVGIHFACCEIYSRIYLNHAETSYTGHCPRCSRKITLRIGPGGTDSRFFTAW